jgi:hypothetical protein
MAAVIKYVMNYFNEYLTLETCDAEAIKMKHKRVEDLSSAANKVSGCYLEPQSLSETRF